MKYVLVMACFGILVFSSCKKEDPFTPTCDGSSPTYDSDISLIISNNCLGCHGTGSPNGNFSTYAGISVVTSNGKFKQRVLIDRSMPKNGSLSEATLNKIQCWVDNGYPEN
ncbi:MAG: hypothetical protein JKY09_06120 [Crocinitomicaceae bacterium]|nr:hypothetical protein [Crocinitomicaceae bacterium]